MLVTTDRHVGSQSLVCVLVLLFALLCSIVMNFPNESLNVSKCRVLSES